MKLTKTKVIVLTVVVAVLAVIAVAGIMIKRGPEYVQVGERVELDETIVAQLKEQVVDDPLKDIPEAKRYYAANPETKQRVSDKPLVFLYGINAETGKVLVYSPVLGEVKFQHPYIQQQKAAISDKATLTKKSATVTVVTFDPGAPVQVKPPFPSLNWTDMQGAPQRQFFVQGVNVIYISSEPLAETDDHVLLETATVAAASK